MAIFVFMQQLDVIRKYLAYRFSSKTKFDVHPPFLFDLVTKVFNNKRFFPDYVKPENLRKKLMKNKTIIEIEDYGAGSSLTNSKFRSISQIAKSASEPKKYGRLLFRLVNYFKPATIVELGTSLGLSSVYMALGNPEAKVFTIEGCRNIFLEARKNIDELSLTNIELINGKFDEVLPELLANQEKVDFVFIDGNHRREPTISYFEHCLGKADNNTVIVFDDIHWSEEMEAAWMMIKQHPSVTLSVDIFFMGMVFFKKELSEEHFIIKY